MVRKGEVLLLGSGIELQTEILDRVRSLKGVIAVVIYGSFARGDIHRKSDIDLFIIFEDEKTRNMGEKSSADIFFGFTDRFVQTVCMTVDEIEAGKREALVQKVFREGELLYLAQPLKIRAEMVFSKKAFKLYNYDLRHLESTAKKRFSYALYGRIVGKYKYEGLLKEAGGRKIGPTTILVYEEGCEKIDTLIKEYGVKVERTDVWL